MQNTDNKRPQKIKKSHLDQTLINWILGLTKAGYIQYSDLSPDLKRMIRTGGDSSGYNDAPLIEDINNLKEGKVDKVEMLKYFNKEADKLEIENLSSTLQSTIKIVPKLRAAMNIDNIRLKSDPIHMSDLEPSVQNKIENVDQRIAQIRNTLETTQNVIAQLDSALGGELNASNLTETLNNLKTTVNKTAEENKERKKDIDQLIATVESLRNDVNTSMSSDNSDILAAGKINEKFIPESVAKASDINYCNREIEKIKQALRISENKMQVGFDSKKYVISPKSKIELGADDLDNVNISTIKIMLIDEDTSSKTYNMAINSEGYVSVAYKLDEDKMILLNECDKEVKILLMYQRMENR